MLIPAELFPDCLAVYKTVYLYLHILLIFVPFFTSSFVCTSQWSRNQFCIGGGGQGVLGGVNQNNII